MRDLKKHGQFYLFWKKILIIVAFLISTGAYFQNSNFEDFNRLQKQFFELRIMVRELEAKLAEKQQQEKVDQQEEETKEDKDEDNKDVER